MASGSKEMIEIMESYLTKSGFTSYNRNTQQGDYLIYTADTEKEYTKIIKGLVKMQICWIHINNYIQPYNCSFRYLLISSMR